MTDKEIWVSTVLQSITSSSLGEKRVPSSAVCEHACNLADKVLSRCRATFPEDTPGEEP